MSAVSSHLLNEETTMKTRLLLGAAVDVMFEEGCDASGTLPTFTTGLRGATRF